MADFITVWCLSLFGAISCPDKKYTVYQLAMRQLAIKRWEILQLVHMALLYGVTQYGVDLHAPFTTPCPTKTVWKLHIKQIVYRTLIW